MYILESGLICLDHMTYKVIQLNSDKYKQQVQIHLE